MFLLAILIFVLLFLALCLTVSLLSCGIPEDSESQLFLLFLFGMEGCRYNGMQRRLPEASQWMDRVKQQGDKEKRREEDEEK